VLGGSAASSFKDDINLSWPYLLKASLPSHIEFKVETRGGLTLVRAMSELINFQEMDLLILHFGTSIGWPNSIVRLGYKLGFNFTSEFAFHQPAYRSSAISSRIKRGLKNRIRNSVKYLLFFTGKYKSPISHREIDDQIKAVVLLAKSKTKSIIWIQHQALRNNKVFLEKRSYQRYYMEIIESLNKYKSEDFQVFTLPYEFLVQENYLLDSVHLSPKGHQNLLRILRGEFGRL